MTSSLKLVELSSALYHKSLRTLYTLYTCTCTWMSQKQIVKFASARRMKASLSLITCKRKQLRSELCLSQPHPPLGTRFLPLSRTDTFFFVQSRDTFIQSSVRPTSTPTTPAVPFPILSLFLSYIIHYSLSWHCPLISSPMCTGPHKTYSHANGIYWECSFLFPISIQISESLSSWHADFSQNKSP